MARTESVSDEKQFNEDRNSTKLIHSHYTLNSVIFARAFKLFLMCQTYGVIQSWQSQHCSSFSSVGVFSWKKVNILYEQFTENKLGEQYVSFYYLYFIILHTLGPVG